MEFGCPPSTVQPSNRCIDQRPRLGRVTDPWTNEAAIEQWNSTASRAAMEATATDGDFAKRHLVNPVVFRMLGDVRDSRVLDAGCGPGYLSRLLASAGARVVGVEPTDAMCAFAREKESQLAQGIDYIQADLARLPEQDGPLAAGSFDAVVCSMVLMAIPDWKPALRACVHLLKPGGLAVFAIVHPAFEQLRKSWCEHEDFRTRRYLKEYEITGPAATDFHRPVSAYLNELSKLGCRLREFAEPGLDPAVAAGEGKHIQGVEAYVRFPNFLIMAAEAPA